MLYLLRQVVRPAGAHIPLILLYAVYMSLIINDFCGVELPAVVLNSLRVFNMASLMRSFLQQPPPPLPHLRPREMGPGVGVIKPSCSSAEAYFTWKSERFIRCCAIAQPALHQARPKRKSIIWWFGEDIVKESDVKLKQPYWYCYLCEEESLEMNNLLAVGDGNNGILSHLEKSHKINRHTGLKASFTPSEETSESSSLPGLFGR